MEWPTSSNGVMAVSTEAAVSAVVERENVGAVG
jgi:hypothetical protein